MLDKKYLLITTDDFGASHSINRGILNGFVNGLVKSTNFMATTPWFPEAVRYTKDNNLPVGVHMTLTCEWTNMKHSPITGAKSLTDSSGYFYSSYEELIEKMDIEEVKIEYRAQIDRVIDMGIKPTHVDSHMLPPLLFATNYAQNKIAAAIEEVADEYGLIYTYAVKDNKLKYFDKWFELTQNSYSFITERLKGCDSGLYHLICHCGFDTDEQRSLALPTEPVYSWGAKCRQNDMDIITSKRFKNFLKENDFILIGIKELLELLPMR